MFLVGRPQKIRLNLFSSEREAWQGGSPKPRSASLIGTKAFRTLDATSQQTSQEAVKDVVSLRIRDHMIANTLMEKRQVAKPSASTKNPSKNKKKDNSKSYRLNQSP